MCTYAIEELRSMVNFFDYQNETFNMSFTMDELIQLYRYCMMTNKAYKELPEFPDTWTDEQINEALAWDGNSDLRPEFRTKTVNINEG